MDTFETSDATTGAVATERRPAIGLLESLVEVLGHLDFERQLEVLVSKAVEYTGASYGLALGEGEEPGTLRVSVSSGPSSDPRHRAFGHLDGAQVREVVGDSPALANTIAPLQRLVAEWPGAETVAGSVPLTSRSGVWMGVLLIASEHGFRAEGWRDLLALVEASRDAFDNARQVARMRDLVIKDDTAHCYNRRYFEEFLPEEIARASRFRAPLSLIFLDMDNLKQVNNDHGHAVGSRTLTEVSSRIRRKIRKFDRLFRFGGDEFCILLPETEWHGAMEVAERVREEIAGKPFLLADLEGGVAMSASLGIASYPLHARTQLDLIHEADRAMQRVKKNVKNGVAVAEIHVREEPGSQT